jgi:chitinase
LTTITTTYIATVCTACAKPTSSAEYPVGWTTSIYTDKTVTVTITKPIATSTDVPAYPSSVPSEVYPADYPASPVSSGKPAYPSSIPSEVYPADYPASPVSSGKPAYPAVPEASHASEYPAYPAVPASSVAASSSPALEYPSYPISSSIPEKAVEEAITSTVYLTFTTVPVPAYTPAPYPSAGGAPYVPAGPANNATSAYVPVPTGTGKPATPSAYTPAEFEGAASKAGVGLMMLVGVVGAVLMF